MPSRASSVFATLLTLVLLARLSGAVLAADAVPGLDAASARAAERLVATHGEAERVRIERGLAQMRPLWRERDGDAAAFENAAVRVFVPKGPALDASFERLEAAMEAVDGYMSSLRRDLQRGQHLDLGPKLVVDDQLAALAPGAHIGEDLFAGGVGWTVLMNFAGSTLEEREAQGESWTRRRWAEARLVEGFETRVPGEVQAQIAAAFSNAGSYMGDYYIRMDHLRDPAGETLFPEGLRLITHWNLRDEIKGRYGVDDGLRQQRVVADVLEAIVRQTIPAAVVDNPELDWQPSTGKVWPEGADASREPDTRYARWMDVFHAMRGLDAYDPRYPNLVERSFARGREMSLERVRGLLVDVLSDPLAKEVAAEISQRLGRELEDFDIWYAGFRPSASHDEAALSAKTRALYPDAAALDRDLPRILETFGFSPERAAFLGERIVVDNARGAGHAYGPARRGDNAHLRTRVREGGLDYKGFNIAIHEFGHNCEQIFSQVTIDHTLLAGVPNNGFTEALAMIFQERDLEALGVAEKSPDAWAYHALEEFWATREIAGVSLVEIDAWIWLDAHPDASPAEFRVAVVEIAQRVWNSYFAEALGVRDSVMLAVYSHFVQYGFYVPNYFLGHLIAFQVGDHFRTLEDKSFGAEFERVSQLGRIAPDAWMRAAVGAPLSAKPLLERARQALPALAKSGDR